MIRDWEAVEAAVAACVAKRPGEYDAATRAVMTDLIGFLRSTGRPAPEVGPGYWPTFQLNFDAPGVANLSLEVFADRIEVYRFHEGRFDVWDELHQPGQGFSQAFADEIPALTEA